MSSSRLDQRMWGSNALLSLPFGPDVSTPETQLADVPLPESCVCSIYFQADIVSPPSQPGIVESLFIKLSIGLGRSSLIRTIAWAGVPVFGAPLEFTLDFVPAATVLATVGAQGRATAAPGPLQILCTLNVAPISRFPQSQGLKFGMAKAGEADGLDDGLLEELEAHSPDEADVMREAQDDGHDLTEEEPARRGAPNIPPNLLPPRVRRFVERYTRRIGHPPRVRDLPPWAQAELQSHLRRGQ
jgi:hypothetical protein